MSEWRDLDSKHNTVTSVSYSYILEIYRLLGRLNVSVSIIPANSRDFLRTAIVNCMALQEFQKKIISEYNIIINTFTFRTSFDTYNNYHYICFWYMSL